MGIFKSIWSSFGDDRGKLAKVATRALRGARSAVREADRAGAIDHYCKAIRAHQENSNALAAAQTAKEALDEYPGELRVLRLISRIYAAKGAHAEDQGSSLLLLAAAGHEDDAIPANPGEGESAARIEIPRDRLAVLSLFPETAFERLVSGSRFHKLEPGKALFAPGGMGASIFLITEGAVQVLETMPDGREVETARVGAGGICGVFSYMTGRPRSALVRSLTQLTALEIPSQVLDYECAQDERFSKVLARFCRDRLLLNLLSTLPGYRDLRHDQKAKLLGRFRLRNADPGEEIIGQGATEPFLGLVVDGCVRVVHKAGSFSTEAALLEAGDCVGNVGSPPASPAEASVLAGELGCKIAILPARFTKNLRATHPLISDPRPELASRDQILAGGIFCATAAIPAALVPAAWR